jgi:NADPH:quinone reductase-like Zn-dependent oxidoreductase
MSQLPSHMKGVVLTHHGDLDALSFRHDLPLPIPAATDVVIKVAAAGVNNTDINTRKGWYTKDDSTDVESWNGEAFVLPRIQGADVCGYIVAVGSKVDTARIGERVIIEPCLTEADGAKLPSPWYFGSECDGGFAQYTKVAAKHAYTVNTSMSDAELASFPCSYSTAENMLHRANVVTGDRVLVTGASGGVGSAAVQLAKARGAFVVAITSESKQDALKALGADDTLTRDCNWLAYAKDKPFDVVIDLVAGPRWPELLEMMRPFGRYAVSGAIGGHSVTLDVRTLYLKDLQLLGCTMISEKVFGNLVKRIEAGDIAPLVSKTYPIEEIKQAQTDFEQKAHIGKLVLTL